MMSPIVAGTTNSIVKGQHIYRQPIDTAAREAQAAELDVRNISAESGNSNESDHSSPLPNLEITAPKLTQTESKGKCRR